MTCLRRRAALRRHRPPTLKVDGAINAVQSVSGWSRKERYRVNTDSYATESGRAAIRLVWDVRGLEFGGRLVW